MSWLVASSDLCQLAGTELRHEPGEQRRHDLGFGHVRITNEVHRRCLGARHVIEYGLDIGNSEVCLRSVQVVPITYILKCTNGMREWKSEAALRMRHVGDPRRLQDQLRDAVPVAFAEARDDIERWRKAAEVLIDNALEEIEGLRAFGLGQADVQAVARELAVTTGLLAANAGVTTISEVLKAPTTAYDVANAVTAVARDRTEVAARLTMEEHGHRYLTRRTA